MWFEDWDTVLRTLNFSVLESTHEPASALDDVIAHSASKDLGPGPHSR